MVQFFQSKRGSTLAMMLIIMAILTTLGVAILSATLMGHRFKVINNREKTAFYISEAGLDESYAYLGEEVENAIEYAQQIYIPGQMGIASSESINSGILTERTAEQKRALPEDEYKDLLDQYFRTGYQNYFIENREIIRTNIVSELLVRSTDDLVRIQGQHGEPRPVVTCAVADAFVSDQLIFTFRIQTNRINLDGSPTPASERIDCNLAVGTPNYNTPFTKQITQFSVMRNALWDKALATDRNIYVLGDNVTVNGNVYAYGDDITSTQPQMKGYGGIVVGGVNDRTLSTPDTAVSGRLTVEGGNVVTDKEVVTLVSSSLHPSTVTIGTETIGEDLYCNSLVASIGIEGVNPPNTGADIEVNGNVSILDDTELNSKDSEIMVNGSYFGFSSGSETDTNHNSSSSIVVNAEDISELNRSKLTIKGGGDKFPDIIQRDEPLAFGGIYLSGTVYVNDQTTYTGINTQATYGIASVNPDGRYQYIPTSAPTDGSTTDTFIVSTERVSESGTDPGVKTVTVELSGNDPVEGVVSASYQTGDSVSVVGNYLGYAQKLYVTADPRFSGIDETYYRDFWPLSLITDMDGVTGKEKMFVRDKAEYSMLAKEEYSSIFDFGSGNIRLHNGTIDNTNIMFSLGTYINQIHKDAGDMFGNMFDDKWDVGEVLTQMWDIRKDYELNTRWIGDTQEIDYLSDSTIINHRPLSHWLTAEWSRTNRNDIFVKDNSGTDNTVFYAKNSIGSNNEVLILRGPDYNEQGYLNLVNRITNTEHKTPVLIDLPTADIDQVTGIILAKSDVYVLGEVDYSGLLMAQGDIWLIDDEPKTFSNLNRGAGGTLVGANWNDANPVVNMVFDDIARRPGLQLGDFFTQASQDSQGSEWSKRIVREIPTTAAYSGVENLSFAGSMNGIIQVTGWSRTNQTTTP